MSPMYGAVQLGSGRRLLANDCGADPAGDLVKGIIEIHPVQGDSIANDEVHGQPVELQRARAIDLILHQVDEVGPSPPSAHRM